MTPGRRGWIVLAWVAGVVSALSLFVSTVPTFDRRCAEAYERNSPAWEMCVERLSSGNGGVRFIRKIELVPVQ